MERGSRIVRGATEGAEAMIRVALILVGALLTLPAHAEECRAPNVARLVLS